MTVDTYIGDYCVEVPASTLADPTSPTRSEWENAVVAGEGRPTFFTGGIVPPGVRTYQSPGSVLPKRVVETRWMPRSYDEVREVADRLEAASKIASKTGE